MDDDAIIKVDHVFKDFILPHERAGTIKGVFTNLFRVHKGGKEMQHALQDISFEVKKGEFFGIVGRNGSGKSTLLKMLAGIYQPSKGAVTVNGRLVPFIELGVGFNAELTGRENVYLNGALIGFSKPEIDAMYDKIVEFAELERFMDQKLKNYSSGMQVRLAFSLAIRAEADILLVDEVLAVGDADFQKKCFKYFKDLKRRQKTVVFVSHDMSSVQEYCDRAILIEQSELLSEGSSYDIAMAYTRMFLEQNQDSNNLKKRKKRWGDGTVAFTSATLDAAKIKDDNQIKLTTTAEIKKDVDEAVLGFKVRSEDDTALLGSNTKLKNHRLKNLKRGDHVSLTWTIPNTFNTGLYFIDISAQSEDYGDVFDWWEDAAQLQVQRSEDNSYHIHPIIEVEVGAV